MKRTYLSRFLLDFPHKTPILSHLHWGQLEFTSDPAWMKTASSSEVTSFQLMRWPIPAVFDDLQGKSWWMSWIVPRWKWLACWLPTTSDLTSILASVTIDARCLHLPISWSFSKIENSPWSGFGGGKEEESSWKGRGRGRAEVSCFFSKSSQKSQNYHL